MHKRALHEGVGDNSLNSNFFGANFGAKNRQKATLKEIKSNIPMANSHFKFRSS
jgi:hypothetical protein